MDMALSLEDLQMLVPPLGDDIHLVNVVVHFATTTYPATSRSKIDLEKNPMGLIEEDKKEVGFFFLDTLWMLTHGGFLIPSRVSTDQLNR